MKLYRIEHPSTTKGMWHTVETIKADGMRPVTRPIVANLTNKEIAELPMPDSDLYRQLEKEWFSSVPTVEMLNEWFTVNDIRELQDLGFVVQRFNAGETFKMDMEIIFTKESQTDLEILTLDDIAGW